MLLSFTLGFAFVEYLDEEGAKKSIEEFISAKRKIPDGLDPGELQSIKSYQIEKEHEQKNEDSEPQKKKPKVLKEIKKENEIKKEIKTEETSEAEGEKIECFCAILGKYYSKYIHLCRGNDILLAIL